MATPNATRIQISTNTSFTSTLIDDTGTYRTSYTPPTNVLTRGVPLYARMRHSTVESGYTPWSATRQFSIVALSKWFLYLTYNLGYSDVYYGFQACASDSLGNIYAVGTVNIMMQYNGYFTYYCTLAKFSSDGTVAWVKLLASGEFISLALDHENNIYVVGSYRYMSGNGATRSADYGILVKYNSSGTVLWQKTCSNSTTSFRSIVMDTELTPYLYFYVNGHSSYHPTIMKFDLSGNLIWQRATSAALGNFNAIAKVGNYTYSIGYIYTASNVYKGYLIKMDTSGNVTWQKYFEFGAAYYHVFQGMYIDTINNHIYLTGYAMISSQTVGMIAKINIDGTPIWVNTLDSLTGGLLRKVLLYNGDVYTTGDKVVSSINKPYFTKFNSAGIFQWAAYLNNAIVGYMNGICLNPSNNTIYCSGAYDKNYCLLTIDGTVPAAGPMPSLPAISWVTDTPTVTARGYTANDLSAVWAASSLAIAASNCTLTYLSPTTYKSLYS